MVWKFSQVRVIEGQFAPQDQEPKLVRVIRGFENSRVRETGGEIIELEGSKSKRNKNWFKILGGSGNWDSTVANLSASRQLGYLIMFCSFILFVSLFLFPLTLKIKALFGSGHLRNRIFIFSFLLYQ